MFVDEQYMSSWEKDVVLAGWKRFIKFGFRDVDFSDPLYQHLIMHCSFIAHTNRKQFYEFFFDDNAAALAVFINQFGGTKQSAETQWVDWRSGSARDLKQAMCEEATALYPTFERVLTEYAQEKYEEEKWIDAQERIDLLPGTMQNAEAMGHMGLIFELVFPFETYLNYLKVDDELRNRLTIGQEIIFTAPGAPPAATGGSDWNLNGRAEETVGAHHLGLFEQREKAISLPPIDAGASSLARRIAALSQTDAEPASAPPLVIEGKKTFRAEL